MCSDTVFHKVFSNSREKSQAQFQVLALGAACTADPFDAAPFLLQHASLKL